MSPQRTKSSHATLKMPIGHMASNIRDLCAWSCLSKSRVQYFIPGGSNILFLNWSTTYLLYLCLRACAWVTKYFNSYIQSSWSHAFYYYIMDICIATHYYATWCPWALALNLKKIMHMFAKTLFNNPVCVLQFCPPLTHQCTTVCL